MSETLCYAVIDGTCYLRLTGELRHTNAGPLDSLIEQLFADSPPAMRAFVIDLNEVSFMDSTMIGLIASIARELREHQLPQATLFSTQPEINQLLQCLCLDRAFTVIKQRAETALPMQLLSDCGCESNPGSTILKAHEALIDLDECNRAAFQPVVDLFREQRGV